MAISISRISGVSASSASSGISRVSGNNYSVSNKSDVSDVYNERTAQGVGAKDGIELVNPVVYPNAHVQAAAKVEKVEAAISADKAYNEVADRFSGHTTTYDAGSRGQGYDTIGANIDVYA